MATRGRVPLSTVLQQLDDDASAELVADGSDDDLGMNSDYDYDFDDPEEGSFIPK